MLLDTNNIALFVAASLVLIATPGPDLIYVLTRGIGQGRKTALVSACGVSLGVVVHTTFATLGLSALLAQSAFAFSVVKYTGGAYLIYLGVRTLLSSESFTTWGEARPVGLGAVFRQGVLSNVLNPKVALTFLAFLPQFVSPNAGSASIQMLILGLIFMALTLIFLCALAFFSGTLGDRLTSRPGLTVALRRLTGCIFVGLGLRLALPERR